MISIQSINLDQGMNWYDEGRDSDEAARFVVVTYGKCLFWINGEKTIVERGDFLYIPSGAPYYGKSVPTVFHEKLVFTVTNCPEDHLSPKLMGKYGLRSKAGCYDSSVERLRSVWQEWEDRVPYTQVRAAATVLDTLALWSREIDRGQEADISLLHVDNMKAYIQTNYRDKLTKEQLGECIGRSPNHAASLFKRVTGQTISQYVHAHRMRTAQYMLTESLLTISEISEYLGYSDVSYFQRIFKKSMGCPPSHYFKLRPKQV